MISMDLLGKIGCFFAYNILELGCTVNQIIHFGLVTLMVYGRFATAQHLTASAQETPRPNFERKHRTRQLAQLVPWSTKGVAD